MTWTLSHRVYVINKIKRQLDCLCDEPIDKEDLTMEVYTNIMHTILDAINGAYYEGHLDLVEYLFAKLEIVKTEAVKWNKDYGL